MHYSVLNDVSEYEHSDLVQRFVNCLPPVSVNKDLLAHRQVNKSVEKPKKVDGFHNSTHCHCPF